MRRKSDIAARAAAMIAASALLLAALAMQSTRAQDAGYEPSQTARNSFAQIAGCLANGEELRVLLVVDESGSLQTTDPDSQRTDGIVAALDSLAALQGSLPEKRISVAASTFADSYSQAIGWGVAEGGHIDNLRIWAENDVPSLNTGSGTDYRAAMLGAQRDLVTETPSCKVMLWFTDGGLDVDGVSTEGALQEICTPGGIADLLRSDGVFIEAAALFSPTSKEVDDQDRANLAQIAEGDAMGGTCGTVPVPERYAGGGYLSANDPSQLSSLFAILLAQISGLTYIESVPCHNNHCVFSVDPGIATFRIISAPIDSSPTYTLTDPSGAMAPIEPNGTAQLGDFTVQSAEAGTTQQVDVELRGGNPVGEWALDVMNGFARIELFMQPGLQVAVADPEQKLAGDEPTDVRLSITETATGEPVNPDVYASFSVSGTIDDGTPVTAVRDGDLWRLDVPAPPPGTLPPSRLLGVSVDIVTKPSGREFDPLVRQFDLAVSVSAAYPSLVSPELIMSDVEGEGTSSGSVELRGSTLGESRACATPVEAQVPQGQGEITISPVTECVDVPQGGSVALDFTSVVNAVTDGAATGEVELKVTSFRSEDPQITWAVPARMNLGRPIDEVTRWALVVLLMALSLALPVLMIYLLGRRLARLQFGAARWIRVIRVPVQVRYDGSAASLMRDGGGFALTDDDVVRRVQAPPGPAERWNAEGLMFATQFKFWGKRRVGRINVPVLDLQPTATAENVDTTRILTSTKHPYADPRGPNSAPASLRPDRDWFLAFPMADVGRSLAAARTSDQGSIGATLIVLIADTSRETDSERGETLGRDDETPLRMLSTAMAVARKQPAMGSAVTPPPIIHDGGADGGDPFGRSESHSDDRLVPDDFGASGAPRSDPRTRPPEPSGRRHRTGDDDFGQDIPSKGSTPREGSPSPSPNPDPGPNPDLDPDW